MSRITRDAGGIDKSALVKIFFVLLMSFFALLCHSCFLKLCSDNDVNSADCKYAYFSGNYAGSDGINALGYALLWAVMVVVCFFGVCTTWRQKHHCSKIFAIILLLVFASISICDYITMGAIGHEVNGSAKDFFLTQMILYWLAELALVVNTAWDVFTTSDEREIDIRDLKDEMGRTANFGSAVLVSQ